MIHNLMTSKLGQVLGVVLFFLQCNLVNAKDLIYIPGSQNNDQTMSEGYESITASSSVDLQNRLSPYSKSAISGSINPAIFELDSKQLMIGLPNRNAITAIEKAFSKTSRNHTKWIGTVSNDPHSSVLITTYNGVSIGRIATAGRVYELKPGINQDYIIEELDTQAFPNCDTDVQNITGPKTSNVPLPPNESRSAGDPVVIDLLAVYTPAAENANGGQPGIQALIQAAVDNANLAFTDSNMDIMFQLVHTAKVNRVEGTSSEDLIWLRDDPGVKNLRNQVSADMVSLISDGSYCGRGYVQRNPGASFESLAVQVTAADCAVGNLTFAHEHGHNMGMEHNPANGISPGSASFVYSFGHYINGSYRTVMSYSDPCTSGCTRVPHFSNPGVMHAGVATGITNQRDNARTGRFTAAIIADFRIPEVSNPADDDDDFLLLFLPAIIQGANQSN